MDFEPFTGTNNNNNNNNNNQQLCRIENFVKFHSGYYSIANGWLLHVVSKFMGEQAVLLKEKLNFKGPLGGSGYAPHCDGPSATAYCQSYRFITAMISLTDHTVDNGCLRVSYGDWNEERLCALVATTTNNNNDDDVLTKSALVAPEEGSSKSREGRVGALTPEIVSKLDFQPLPWVSGSAVLFNNWVPHRSSMNMTNASRDATFFICNTLADYGDPSILWVELSNYLLNARGL